MEMKVLGIEPRDVYVMFEMSHAQIELVLDFLDKSTVEYDSKEEPKLAEAVSYVKNDFFATLNQVSADLKEGAK